MQDLSGMLVSIAAHLSDPDTNPASDKKKEALRLRNRKYIRDLTQILCMTLDIFEFLEPVGPNATAKKHLS